MIGVSLRPVKGQDGQPIPGSVAVIVATSLAIVALAIGASIAIIPVVVLIKCGSLATGLSDVGAIVASLAAPLLAIVGILASLGGGHRRPESPTPAP